MKNSDYGIIVWALSVFLAGILGWNIHQDQKPDPCGILLDLDADLLKLEKAWPVDGDPAHRIARNEAFLKALNQCLGRYVVVEEER